MNINYAKAILYAYPSIDEMSKQIDYLVEERALSSFCDFSPCVDQCANIITLMNKKTYLFYLKERVRYVLHKLSQYERALIEYKYFKKKNTEILSNLDTSSRAYFRNQIKVLNKFSTLLEKTGITDKIFVKKFLSISLFRSIYGKVLEREKALSSYKKRYTDFIPKTIIIHRTIGGKFNVIK